MSGGIEYLPDISECISDGHELYIFYTNDKGNEVEGRFRPEGLKLFHNRWYLLGYRNGSEFCTVRKHSIFRHDNFIGCFSADKIKISVRKYFCFNIPIDKNMAEGLFCRSPYHEEYIQTSASGNPEDLCH